MDANGMRETELKPSPHDYILRPWFKIVSRALDITLIRFVLACYLFPIYVFVKFLSVLPITLSQSKLLLTTNGRARLIRLTASYREQEEQQAAQQLDGTFSFQLDQVLKDEEGKGWLANLAWKPHREEVLVCGAMVSVVHEVPDNAAMRSGKTIVLLHGNPSWSFVWRNVRRCLVLRNFWRGELSC